MLVDTSSYNSLNLGRCREIRAYAFVVDDDAAEVLVSPVSYGGADWAMRSNARSR